MSATVNAIGRMRTILAPALLLLASLAAVSAARAADAPASLLSNGDFETAAPGGAGAEGWPKVDGADLGSRGRQPLPAAHVGPPGAGDLRLPRAAGGPVVEGDGVELPRAIRRHQAGQGELARRAADSALQGRRRQGTQARAEPPVLQGNFQRLGKPRRAVPRAGGGQAAGGDADDVRRGRRHAGFRRLPPDLHPRRRRGQGIPCGGSQAPRRGERGAARRGPRQPAAAGGASRCRQPAPAPRRLGRVASGRQRAQPGMEFARREHHAVDPWWPSKRGRPTSSACA